MPLGELPDEVALPDALALELWDALVALEVGELLPLALLAALLLVALLAPVPLTANPVAPGADTVTPVNVLLRVPAGGAAVSASAPAMVNESTGLPSSAQTCSSSACTISRLWDGFQSPARTREGLLCLRGRRPIGDGATQAVRDAAHLLVVADFCARIIAAALRGCVIRLV